MPQMSPLLWSYLFLAFSFLLILSMIKIYFSTPKNLFLQNNNIFDKETNSSPWMW